MINFRSKNKWKLRKSSYINDILSLAISSLNITSKKILLNESLKKNKINKKILRKKFNNSRRSKLFMKKLLKLKY